MRWRLWQQHCVRRTKHSTPKPRKALSSPTPVPKTLNPKDRSEEVQILEDKELSQILDYTWHLPIYKILRDLISGALEAQRDTQPLGVPAAVPEPYGKPLRGPPGEKPTAGCFAAEGWRRSKAGAA